MKNGIPRIVSQIVGRCHVGDSNRRVIKYFVSRLAHKYQTWKTISRDERRKWLRWIIAEHAENRRIYARVMTGRF